MLPKLRTMLAGVNIVSIFLQEENNLVLSPAGRSLSAALATGLLAGLSPLHSGLSAALSADNLASSVLGCFSVHEHSIIYT